MEKATQQGTEENIRWIEKSTIRNPQSAINLLTALFGLHASFTLSNTTLKQAAELGNELNCGFHIHLAEDKVDQQDTQKKYRKSVVRRLTDLGILGRKTIAAHGVHLSQSEMKLLKETDTIVVHNPASNMNNAVGIAPIPAMLKKGILVGLGTDGLGNDMFSELRTASFIHKLAHHDPRVFPPNTAVQLAIENNRKIAARFFTQPLGMLASGYAADIIIVDYSPSTALTAKNIASHLVYGMLPAKVDTVFISGKKVLENGRIVTVDEAAIVAEAQKLAKKLWNRIYAK